MELKLPFRSASIASQNVLIVPDGIETCFFQFYVSESGYVLIVPDGIETKQIYLSA